MLQLIWYLNLILVRKNLNSISIMKRYIHLNTSVIFLWNTHRNIRTVSNNLCMFFVISVASATIHQNTWEIQFLFQELKEGILNNCIPALFGISSEISTWKRRLKVRCIFRLSWQLKHKIQKFFKVLVALALH